MRKEQIYTIQLLFSGIGAWFGNKLGILFPMLVILILMMVADQFTGLLAAKKEALDHPDDVTYGWSSNKWRKGIYKKFGYIMTVVVAITVDYIIFRMAEQMGIAVTGKTFFGLLTAVWLILNELLSITENAGRLGAPLPDFLTKILVVMKEKVEHKADKESEEIQK